MGKHTGYHGFTPTPIHETGLDTTAAAMLQTGLWERAEQWTPLDEVVRREESGRLVDGDGLREGVVMVPLEDYERLVAAAARPGVKVDGAGHEKARAGWVLVEKEALEEERMQARLHTLTALMRFVWSNSDHLWGAMRNLLAITHKFTPQFIRGMSGRDIGQLLGIGRQAVNAHELKLLEKYLPRWGVSAVHGPGGSKGVVHREKKREQMLGRRHRAKDYVPEKPETKPRMTRRQLEALEREAEAKRLERIRPGEGNSSNH